MEKVRATYYHSTVDFRTRMGADHHAKGYPALSFGYVNSDKVDLEDVAEAIWDFAQNHEDDWEDRDLHDLYYALHKQGVMLISEITVHRRPCDNNYPHRSSSVGDFLRVWPEDSPPSEILCKSEGWSVRSNFVEAVD